jgi:hypothetical protein
VSDLFAAVERGHQYMARPRLKTCAFLGPAAGPEQASNWPLPADYETNPFKYLPPRLTLSDAELELASRYNRGDFSGGYIASQIAFFRCGPSAENHRRRRERFQRMRAEVDRLGLVLPPAYVELVESDDHVSRLRHNNIWLRIPDEIVPLPSAPDHMLYLIFYESQGCGYWHLLLSPDGGHVVTTSEHHFGIRYEYPGLRQPDPAAFEVYQCAESFPAWIVNYFAECLGHDRHYESLLNEYQGM